MLLVYVVLVCFSDDVGLADNTQWTVEQAQVFLAEMRMAMRDKNVHAYLPV